METFVNKVAHYIKKSSIPMEDWVIVIPSERAKQYLQKASASKKWRKIVVFL